MARRDAGGLIVAAKTGLYFYDPETGARHALVDPEKDAPGNRFNDGTTGPRGRFWHEP
ncbi:MAG: SMP-30/gluconolactonase/LRE family protein [bacterium]|nr:SMP-30/gluconolactonase/LRE family protein [bacterium]